MNLGILNQITTLIITKNNSYASFDKKKKLVGLFNLEDYRDVPDIQRNVRIIGFSRREEWKSSSKHNIICISSKCIRWLAWYRLQTVVKVGVQHPSECMTSMYASLVKNNINFSCFITDRYMRVCVCLCFILLYPFIQIVTEVQGKTLLLIFEHSRPLTYYWTRYHGTFWNVASTHKYQKLLLMYI